MQEERYPGEHHALRVFLRALAPVADRELGPDAMLTFAIHRALGLNTLAELRRARRLFNQLPTAAKQRLSNGLIARTAGPPKSAAASPARTPPFVRVLESLSDTGIAIRLVRPEPGNCPS